MRLYLAALRRIDAIRIFIYYEVECIWGFVNAIAMINLSHFNSL